MTAYTHESDLYPFEHLPEEEYFGRDPRADLEHWSRMAYWTLEEGIALSYGYDPNLVNPEWFAAQPHSFGDEYRRQVELAARAMAKGLLEEHSQPLAFIAWAKTIGIPFCPKLEESVRKKNRTVAGSAEQNRPLGTKEQQTLLKLVLGLAVDGYGYRPKDSRSKVIPEIKRNLESVGVKLDEDTIRKWLREAADEHGHLLVDR